MKKTYFIPMLIGCAFVVLLAAVLIWLVVAWSVETGKRSSKIGESIESEEGAFAAKTKTQKIKCQEGWDEYENEVIGLGFCHPKEWGDPVTSPVASLTKLEGVVDEYSKDEHNLNSNSIFLEFENIRKNSYETRNDLKLRFFNEKYGGQYYPNAMAYGKGYVDNILQLKSSGNICEYKTNFTKPWEYGDTMTEFWSECKNDIKNEIIEREQSFSGAPHYSYELRSQAYFKLQNGYFDNLLITRKYGDISQSKKNINQMAEIFEAGNYPSNPDNSNFPARQDYEKHKREFQAFVDSVYIFEPQPKAAEEFEPVPNEDPNVTAIRKYYWLVTTHQIEEAYQMKIGGEESQEEFDSWYGNVYFAKPRDFVKVSGDTYKFFVDFQEQNQEKTLYRIVAKVSEGKIENQSSEEIVTEMKESKGRVAYSKIQHGKSYVILEENGQQVVVDQGVASYDEDYSNLGQVKAFTDIRFSESGDFLLYRMYGWEWSQSYVFDIAKRKNVLTYDSPTVFEFTPDEKNFFACSSAGMSSSPAGFVYGVPQFEKQFDLLSGGQKGVFEVDCEYDAIKNAVNFTYSGIYGGCEENNDCVPETTVRYSLMQKKVIE